MNYFKYFILALVLALPTGVLAQPFTQNELDYNSKDKSDDELYTYYDLRQRNTFIQVTRVFDEDQPDPPDLCIHVQIFQQDRGCGELNFEDRLTLNDTVVYNMNNIVRNDGSPVPINLDDDSYGIVTISTFDCNNRNLDPGRIIGNVRIIDDSDYEYRMNLFTTRDSDNVVESSMGDPAPVEGNLIIPFNTVDGATHSDVIIFVTEEDRAPSGSDDGPTNDLIYNEEAGVTFSVFLLDENEEKLSCDQKTFGCGPNVILNYGINEDYPASRGSNLLCEGGGLLPGQTHGYVSLENASFLSPLNVGTDFDLFCMYGLNNNNGTGSMDACLHKCVFGRDDFGCNDPPS